MLRRTSSETLWIVTWRDSERVSECQPRHFVEDVPLLGHWLGVAPGWRVGMYRALVRRLLTNSRSARSLPAVEHWRCKMAYFGEVMRSIRTEQLSLAYLSNYVECEGRRRAIPPPIAYNPELTRCTHEASEAVSRA